jgi:para-nitrobenzyl esterase
MPAAKGLFHRAIIQSGSYARNAHLEAMSPDVATCHARTLLAAAGLGPTEARKLFDMPMAAVIEAIAKARQAEKPPVWRPVADGTNLPSGPSWPAAPTVSADVPLMIGTTATEMSMLMGMLVDPTLFDLDEAGLRKRVATWYATDKLDAIIKTFRAKSPSASPGQLFFDIATATVFRRGAWTHADLKAEQNKAPVYLYEIDWATPVGGGKWGSPHSLEHPFVFDNVALSESMVGTSRAEPQAMADQISPTWVAFARSGNPNNEAIPHWPAYTVANHTTMVFDTESRVVEDFREDERKLVQAAGGKAPL